jgi:hypothetical protein
MTSAAPLVVVCQSDDVARSIGRPGLLEARLSAAGSSTRVVREAAGRFDVLLQRIAAAGAVPESGVPPSLHAWFAAQFTTSLTSADLTMGVLSVRDEVVADVWRHRAQGWLVQPPAGFATEWDDEQRGWLAREHELTSRPSPAASVDLLRRISASVTGGAVLVVYNISTYDPAGVRHDFTEDVFPILAHRIDLELERTAGEAGIALIDVDRSVAEYGGAKAVIAPATYTDAAAAVIAEDALAAINEFGIAGLALDSDVMRMTVPAYDRRTTRGRIDAWHVAPGAAVEPGTPLFDLTFDNLVHRLDYAPAETNRSMCVTVLAAAQGRVTSVDAPDGAEVAVGQTVGVVVKDDTVPTVPVGVVDDGIPPFRIGIRVK